LAERAVETKKAIAGVSMRPECVPCALRAVLAAVRQVSDDDWLASKVLHTVMSDMPEVDPERTPAEYTSELLAVALKVAGSSDPYKEERQRQNSAARALLPLAQKAIDASDDSMEIAVRLAVAGNCFDPLLVDYDAAEYVRKALEQAPARFDYAEFRKAARSAKKILYILDNCGEAVFDKLLVSELAGNDREIFVAVRHAPMLNDVTRQEAEELSFSDVAKIVDPGRPMLGVVRSHASTQFRDLLKSVDMVISKGQANYETLANAQRDMFYLLQVKCQVVADHIGLRCGDASLAYIRSSS
jgi:damage-control phosphatase, subfamily I